MKDITNITTPPGFVTGFLAGAIREYGLKSILHALIDAMEEAKEPEAEKEYGSPWQPKIVAEKRSSRKKETDDIPEDLAEWIREHHVTRTEAARKLGVHVSTLSLWLKNGRVPSLAMKEKIRKLTHE